MQAIETKRLDRAAVAGRLSCQGVRPHGPTRRERRRQGEPARLDRPRRHRHPVPHLFDGPHGPLSRRAADRRRSEAELRAELLWIVDIYGFMVAGALVTMGTLGDRIGRRRVLLIGAAAFGVTSVLAAYLDQHRDADRRPRAAGPRRRRRWRRRRFRSSATCSSIRRSAPSPSAFGSRASRPAPSSVRWSAA